MLSPLLHQTSMVDELSANQRGICGLETPLADQAAHIMHTKSSHYVCSMCAPGDMGGMRAECVLICV